MNKESLADSVPAAVSLMNGEAAHGMLSFMPTISFVILGVLAIIVAGFMITRQFPVNAAVLLIVDFILLAGMYGLLDAHFAAVAQIVVYAGAIMIVFVFVIMLLNLPAEELHYGKVTAGEWLIAFLGVGAAIALGTSIGQGAIGHGLRASGIAQFDSTADTAFAPLGRSAFYPMAENVKNVSSLLFTEYVWAFELVGVLLMIGLIGAVVIAKKRNDDAQSA